MSVIHAASALLPQGWAKNVRLVIADGCIDSVTTEAPAEPGDERHQVLLPGMPNLHSHAFQRGMAGLTEVRGDGPDSFWSWRELMYRFALKMSPEQVEAVAAQLYMEMLEAGFSRVGEFHYLHHGPDGRAYDNLAEMAERILAAADETGIRLTLLPVFYAHAGFGGLPPAAQQRRFICNLDQFGRLLDDCKAAVASLPGAVLGVAPHSLRAVMPKELHALIQMAGSAPIHMHIAEQLAEVEACKGWSGARPVEWLLDNADVDGRWCLIHATHMTQKETRALARSGAVAGLCPVTEANLGDGEFQAKAFVAAGGALGIGSDSNVLIGIDHELRQLEYSQRLFHHARNVLALPGRSTGRFLFEASLAGGSQALQGREAGLAVGGAADLVSLTTGDAPHLEGDALLDGWIFAGSAAVDCVWTGGQKRVAQGRHMARESISRTFRQTLQAMLAS